MMTSSYGIIHTPDKWGTVMDFFVGQFEFGAPESSVGQTWDLYLDSEV